MLVVGSLLALISGMFNATAAWLEKREGMRTATARQGLRLLAALARRPAWLLAMVLSAVAWVAEAASLALAPVPVVATLRNAGRGLLVVGGHRWLEERFSPLEMAGVVLASAGGAITAVGADHSQVVRKPLSNWTELIVGASCALAAGVVVFASSRWGGGPGPSGDRRRQAAGVGRGAAVGLLFAGTGVFTKEIGDRFAIFGAGGLAAVLPSTGVWLMIVMSVWAQSLLQQAFRRANAASVSAANASVASLGLIGAGFALYHQNLPGGAGAGLLIGGVAVSLAGTALLLGSRPVSSPRPPGPERPERRRQPAP
jgi:drug/metabolite transporter (DMT)-like permease